MNDTDAQALLETYPFRVIRAALLRLKNTQEGKAVQARLAADARVKALEGKLISMGNGRHPLTLPQLGSWYLWYEQLAGREAAEVALERFLADDEIEVVFVMWVLGVKTAESLEILDGIRLVPASQLPESRETDYLKIKPVFPTEPFHTVMPESALVWRVTVPKVVTVASPERPTEMTDHLARLHDVAILLNALDGWCVQPRLGTTAKDPHVPVGPFGGMASAQPHFDVNAPKNLPPAEIPPGLLARLETARSARNMEERKRYDRIMYRLGQAKRREDLSDKILDLGIVLEMLLLHGTSSREQLSLTFRTRGAWLLGKTPAERAEILKILQRLYNLRSAVAHSGTLGKEKVPELQKEVVGFERLACEILRVLLITGEPDWDKLVLGGEAYPTAAKPSD